jgi:hypothetical protein
MDRVFTVIERALRRSGCSTLSFFPRGAMISVCGRIGMPSSVNLYQIGVWLCVGFSWAHAGR